MSDSDSLKKNPNRKSVDQTTWNILRKMSHFGLRIKRWLLIGIIGIGICSIGFAFVIKNLFALITPNILPWHLEGIIVAFIGFGFVLISGYGLFRSIGPFLFRYNSVNSLAQTIYERRSRERGPKIVAIGGGTGLSVLLRGIKEHTDNITAIVTVADDGGSSGRLRRELGLLPPGDIRNCLVALSDDEGLVAKLFQYRFDQGDGLEGHNFGNLFIAAMTDVSGSFEQALYESSKVLAVHGKILPATTDPLTLSAKLTDGTTVHGESNITQSTGNIDRLFIDPADIESNPDAITSINEADIIVIGPGSLFTSILPNLLVPGINKALESTAARKIYVCNVAQEIGETDGYSAQDHVRTLQTYTSENIVNLVIINQPSDTMEGHRSIHPVIPGTKTADNILNISVITTDLINPHNPIHHDPEKLAQVIIDVYHNRVIPGRAETKSVVG